MSVGCALGPACPRPRVREAEAMNSIQIADETYVAADAAGFQPRSRIDAAMSVVA